MFNLFKPKSKKKHAMIFIDYESWFYSYKTLYNGMRPDPKRFRENLEQEFIIDDIMVFGDFSSPPISNELGSLRSLTNTIIETGNTFNRRKKDMTDFIMLDYIYQYVDAHNKVDTYIIFTGDGHFQSVVRYLALKKKKQVIVYGVKDTISRQLQEAASEVRELPDQEDLRRHTYMQIARNMDVIRYKRHIVPSFMATVEAVSRFNDIDMNEVKEALQEMLDMGYLHRELRTIRYNTVKVIVADWDKLQDAGLWSPRTER